MAIKLGNTNIGSIYLGSTKISEAYMGSTKIFPAGVTPTPTLIYSNLTEDKSSDGTVVYNVSLGNYRYNLVQISERISSTNGACDLWLEFNNVSGTWPAHSANVWRFRSHNIWRYSHPIRCCQLKTDSNPADWCTDLQTDAKTRSPQDNETCYYYKNSSSSTVPKSTTYVVHSLLIDNTLGTARHYIDGAYTCYGNLVTNGVFNSVAKVRETGMYYYYKNIYIYGSDDDSGLLNIIRS